MAGGPKTTTTSHSTTDQNQQQQGHQSQFQFGSTTPNLPSWFSALKQSVPGMYAPALSQLQSQITNPLYGPQQQAAFAQNLQRTTAQGLQGLQSQLASRGMLNSIAGNTMQTQALLNQANQLGQYNAQIPLLNRQAQSSALGQYGNLLGNLQNLTVPYGTSQTQGGTSAYGSTGQSQSTQDQQQVQQQSGGLLNSLLGGLLNAGLGFATGGLSSLLGGGVNGGGQSMLSTIVNPTLNPGGATGPSQPPPFSSPYGLFEPPPAIGNPYGYQGFNPTFGVQ